MHAELGADGLTEPVSFTLAPAAPAFALRVSALGSTKVLPCFTLEDVVVNDDDTWVGRAGVDDYGDYCTLCAQRISVGSGYGLFMLPSAADAPLKVGSVRARAALRDCSTLTPAASAALGASELNVELASWQPPPLAARLHLPVFVVLATQYGLAADPHLLPDALARMQQIWSAARIDLELQPTVSIAPALAVLEYSANDHSQLTQLAQVARESIGRAKRDPRWPMLIVGTCLRSHDVITGGQAQPWAYTPHLPGGSAVDDGLDQIFVAAERCEGLSPLPSFDSAAQLGVVMAHELGHYLGLYHVQDADGRQDVLSDTDASEPNLMQATPSASAISLSYSQIDIVRRHNAFAVSPHLQP